MHKTVLLKACWIFIWKLITSWKITFIFYSLWDNQLIGYQQKLSLFSLLQVSVKTPPNKAFNTHRASQPPGRLCPTQANPQGRHKRKDNKSGCSHPLLQSRLCFWIWARRRQQRANHVLEITARTGAWQLWLSRKPRSYTGPSAGALASLFLIYFALKHLAINSVLKITGSVIQPGTCLTPTDRAFSHSAQSGINIC